MHAVKVQVPPEDRAHVCCEPQSIQHWEQVEEGSVMWVGEPRLYRYCIVCRWS